MKKVDWLGRRFGVLPVVNANNKRNNINFTYQDKTMSLKAWCRYFNISYKTCMTRYYRGHSIEECLNIIPLKDKRKGVNNGR